MSDVNTNTDYESMTVEELTALSAQLDQERVQLNDRIADVNEVRGRKEAVEMAAQRQAELATLSAAAGEPRDGEAVPPETPGPAPAPDGTNQRPSDPAPSVAPRAAAESPASGAEQAIGTAGVESAEGVGPQ